jgi:hypothetical protein
LKEQPDLIAFMQQEEMFVSLFIFPSHSLYYPDLVLFLAWTRRVRDGMNDNA